MFYKNKILAGFQAIKKLKNDTEQLSDDIDKNLKYVGKEIFGDIEVLLDFNSFFQKMNLH